MLFQLLLQITPKMIHITEVIGIATVLKEVYTPGRAELLDET